ncbi:MAG: hypothetical protein ACRCU1_14775 [Alsobacter sp.]
MDPLMQALCGAHYHAAVVSDAAHVAYWVQPDSRDFHIAEVLQHAALLADAIEAIRAERPDLIALAERNAADHRQCGTASRETKASANG